MEHAEAQAAAGLRRPGSPSEATLVLNHTPCDDPVRPLVCEKILATILPKGTPDDDPHRWRPDVAP
ncbi:hypothetical protein OG470_32850 [Micromonospora sp. NBC_00389]|uniref:DddA-like double-stranded DNA deaminase toxin n=1 Tax=Micromonospora sp. NBC_00389 TaxID=2903586 RepID=UPI002E1ECBED